MAMIEVIYDEISSKDQYENKFSESLNFETIKIKECPSTTAALSLLSAEWFKVKLTQNSSLLSLNFTITGNVNEDDVMQKMGLYNIENKLVIIFESTTNKNCVVWWKYQGGCEKFKYVVLSDAENNFTRLILDFMRISIKFHKSGPFTFSNESFMKKFNDYNDARGFNLLMQASEQNRIDIVKFLIELRICDVNLKINNLTAIDLAWNEGYFDIVYELLQANSKFPLNFQRLSSNGEIQSLTDIFLDLHNLIINHNPVHRNNAEQISQLIGQNSKFRHFYNLDNQSAAFIALYYDKFDIYELLGSKHVLLAQTDPHEEIKIILETFSPNNQRRVREIHKRLVRPLPKKHILKLLYNSFVGFDDLKSEERLSLVWDAFEILDKNEEIKPILELVASAGKFKIFFDFYRDSVQFLDPTVDEGTSGLFYTNGIIYVAAKSLLNDATKNEAIGVLAHELCHFAMVLVYRNLAKPYAVFNNEQERIFNVILNECSDNQDSEQIIKWVFECYTQNLHHAELIVRVPNILGNYYNDDKKIHDLFKSNSAPFKSLYNYYIDKVLIDIRTTTPVLEKINDNKVKWNNLTPQLQSKVKFSEIIFQGEETTLFDLVGDNLKVYDELSSDQIIKLIKSETVEISKPMPVDFKFYIDRRVIEKSFYGKQDYFASEDREKGISKSFDELISQDNRVTILSDFAGSGKSTALVKLAEKFKFKNPSKWIQVIVLQSFFDKFLKYENNKFETKEEISNFFSSILDLEKFEREIFLHLFDSGKIIFLFDGLDEISPILNEFAINLFKKIKDLTENIQFVTTRPDCTFNNEQYRFEPLTADQRNNFFKMFFEKNNLSRENQEKMLQQVNYLISTLEQICYVPAKMDVNSPLIIKMLAEEFSTNDLNEINNFYTIFEKFVKKKLSLIHTKGTVVQRDCDDALMNSMSISQVYQRFGLKLIFKGTTIDKFTSVLENLLLFKLKILPKRKTINRFGILHLNLLNNFSFTHRSFAEFFCARYLIENIYECDDSPSEGEMRERLKLFFNSFPGGSLIPSFIFDYLELKKDDEEETNEFEDIIINLMKNEFHDVLKKFVFTPFFIRCITKFFRKNDEIIEAIWKLNEAENILIYSLKNSLNYSEVIFKITQECLNEKELQKLIDPKNQKGNILYYLWKSHRKEDFDQINQINLLGMEKEKITEILSVSNLLEFIQILKLNLSNAEIKEIFFINGFDIIFSCDNSSEFEELWNEIKMILDKNDLKKMLTVTSETGNTILHQLALKDKEEFFHTLIFSKLEENLSSQEIFLCLIKIVNERQENSLMIFDKRGKLKNLNVFLNFIENHTNGEELKYFLLLFDINNKTFLHHSLTCTDPEIFPAVKDFYVKVLSNEQLRKMFEVKENFQFDEFLIYPTPESTMIELKNFLLLIFKNHKNELTEIICQKNCYGLSMFVPYTVGDWVNFGPTKLFKLLQVSEILREIESEENFEKLNKEFNFEKYKELKIKMESGQFHFSDLK